MRHMRTASFSGDRKRKEKQHVGATRIRTKEVSILYIKKKSGMAAWLHLSVIFLIVCTWFLDTNERIISDIDDDLDFFDGNDKYSPEEESLPFRARRKIVHPRATRVGANLFTARGYGKRGSKSDMGLSSARRFGKRNEQRFDSYLCIITKCKNYSRTLNIDEDIVSFLEEKDVAPPDEDLALEI